MTFLSSCLRTSTFQTVAAVSRGRRPNCVLLTTTKASRRGPGKLTTTPSTLHQNTTTARRRNTTTTNSTTTNTGSKTSGGRAIPKNNATPVHHPDVNGSGSGGKRIGPLSLAIGTIAGTCGSLAGMGGGFIMIPVRTQSD